MYCEKALFCPNGSAPLKTCDSTLIYHLKNTAWLPDKSGKMFMPAYIDIDSIDHRFIFDQDNILMNALKIGTALKQTFEYHRKYSGGATMYKKGYSRKGFFGETIHYDSNGNKIGESRPNFWGGTDHYDTHGNKTGHSERSVFGGVNHYDNNGNKTGYSNKGFGGQTNHYNTNGEKIGESSRGLLGTSNYYGNITSHDHTSTTDEYDMIQDEVLDESYDSSDAAKWLEDNGYDPDEFDL